MVEGARQELRRRAVSFGAPLPAALVARRGRIRGRRDEHAELREFPRRERLVHGQQPGQIFPAHDRGRGGRNDLIRAAIRTHGYSVSEVGRHLGLHYSTISKIATAAADASVERADSQFKT